MSTSEVEHATATKPPAGATRYLPRFEELLARQTLGVAHRARDAMEKSLVGEARQISTSKARARAGMEGHARAYRAPRFPENSRSKSTDL